MKEMSKARLVAIIYDESLTGSQTMQMLEDGFAGMPEGITLTEPYPKLVLEGAEGDYTPGRITIERCARSMILQIPVALRWAITS